MVISQLQGISRFSILVNKGDPKCASIVYIVLQYTLKSLKELTFPPWTTTSIIDGELGFTTATKKMNEKSG